jgi:hypothetical protein
MLGCLPLSCNFEDRGQVPGNTLGTGDLARAFVDLREIAIARTSRLVPAYWRFELPAMSVVSMGRRNTQLRPTFIENKS